MAGPEGFRPKKLRGGSGASGRARSIEPQIFDFLKLLGRRPSPSRQGASAVCQGSVHCEGAKFGACRFSLSASVLHSWVNQRPKASSMKCSRPSSPGGNRLVRLGINDELEDQDIHSLDGVGNDGDDGERCSRRVCPGLQF